MVISPLNSSESLPIANPSSIGTTPSLITQATNSADLNLASNPLLPFINENSVEAISEHVQEKFQGEKGIIGFGHHHVAIPIGLKSVVPSEKYIVENLEQLVKTNNIKAFAFEVPRDFEDITVEESTLRDKKAQADFAGEINKIFLDHKIDPQVTKLVIDSAMKRFYREEGVGRNFMIPELIRNLLDVFGYVSDRMPGLKWISRIGCNENAFENIARANPLLEKVKSIGLKKIAVDAPSIQLAKLRLYMHCKSICIEMAAAAFNLIANSVPDDADQFLRGKQTKQFVKDLNRKDPNVIKQTIEMYLEIANKLSSMIKGMQIQRENIIAENLQKRFSETDGNILALLGTNHIQKSTMEATQSAISKASQEGISTISLGLFARDFEQDQKITDLIPASNKAQYLRADCHESVSNQPIPTDSVSLAQAYDAIITLPKLAP